MANGKNSDFQNIAQSGSSCIGCGRGSNQVMLMRLRTYSRSLCCAGCFVNSEYANCANKNPGGTTCNHSPSEHIKKNGPCSMAGCGCDRWIHGLENEMDRQLGDCVGKKPRMQECNGYGANMGKCGKLIFADPNGEISQLCDPCQRRWISETQEGMRDFAALNNIDPTKVLPN